MRDIYIKYHYLIQIVIFGLVAVVGFYPGSYAILTGERPNPHISIHLHALVMVLWLALLFTQAGLVNRGHILVHKKLGLASIILAPLMCASLCYVTFHGLLAGVDKPYFAVIVNIFIMQLYSIALFVTFFVWAYRSRRSDPETHKRVMVMSTLVLMHAAIGRMPWLPFYNVPESVTSVHLYNLLLIAPSIIYDKITIGKLHKAHIKGLLAFVFCMVLTEIVWGTSWWFSVVSSLVGKQ